MNSIANFTTGNITLIVIGCTEVGGVNRVFELNDEWRRFDVSLSADPTTRLTVWSTTIGGLFLGMSMFGANQPCVQRTCTLKNITLAKWSAFIGAAMLSLFYIMSTVVGLVISPITRHLDAILCNQGKFLVEIRFFLITLWTFSHIPDYLVYCSQACSVVPCPRYPLPLTLCLP